MPVSVERTVPGAATAAPDLRAHAAPNTSDALTYPHLHQRQVFAAFLALAPQEGLDCGYDQRNAE